MAIKGAARRTSLSTVSQDRHSLCFPSHSWIKGSGWAFLQKAFVSGCVTTPNLNTPHSINPGTNRHERFTIDNNNNHQLTLPKLEFFTCSRAPTQTTETKYSMWSVQALGRKWRQSKRNTGHSSGPVFHLYAMQVRLIEHWNRNNGRETLTSRQSRKSPL